MYNGNKDILLKLLHTKKGKAIVFALLSLTCVFFMMSYIWRSKLFFSVFRESCILIKVFIGKPHKPFGCGKQTFCSRRRSGWSNWFTFCWHQYKLRSTAPRLWWVFWRSFGKMPFQPVSTLRDVEATPIKTYTPLVNARLTAVWVYSDRIASKLLSFGLLQSDRLLTQQGHSYLRAAKRKALVWPLGDPSTTPEVSLQTFLICGPPMVEWAAKPSGSLSTFKKLWDPPVPGPPLLT